MKYLTLKEAINKAENDDFLGCKLHNTPNYDFYRTKMDTLTFGMSCDLAISENWQVIKKIREPISKSEAWKNEYTKSNELPTEYYNYFCTGFNVGGKNERLYYIELMESIERYRDDNDIQFHESGILEAFEKIKKYQQND